MYGPVDIYKKDRLMTHQNSLKCSLKHSSHPKGFSLVELMVVIVILGLLAGVVTISVRGYLVRSRQQIARTEIATIQTALDTYYSQNGRYPTNEEGIEILAKKTEDGIDAILSKVPVDPWKNPYEYISPGKNGPYEVICYGADHREGGTGENKDISSDELSSEAGI